MQTDRDEIQESSGNSADKGDIESTSDNSQAGYALTLLPYHIPPPPSILPRPAPHPQTQTQTQT